MLVQQFHIFVGSSNTILSILFSIISISIYGWSDGGASPSSRSTL